MTVIDASVFVDALVGVGVHGDLARTELSAQFHFGASDQYLPVTEADQIRAAFGDHPNTEVHMHADAGHAFDNPSPMFHHPAAAAEAWPQTAAFLKRYLPIN